MTNRVVELVIQSTEPKPNWGTIHQKGPQLCWDALRDFFALNAKHKVSITLIGENGRQIRFDNNGEEGLSLPTREG